ncbi:MAG: hypothetical protein LIP16_14825, partial [Clostridium sp.]|nr:hypothetical protein [Clostridium sp.]
APGPETPEAGTPDAGAPGPETPEGGNRRTGNANAGKSEPYGSGKSSSVTIPEPPLSTGALPGGTGKSQQEGDEE